jgi:hypothetical protein
LTTSIFQDKLAQASYGITMTKHARGFVRFSILKLDESSTLYNDNIVSSIQITDPIPLFWVINNIHFLLLNEK